MKRLQHGDVILKKVDSIPEGAKEIKIYKGFVFERGEGSHTHTLCETKGISCYEKDGIMYLKVENKTPLLDHEEHGVEIFEPGIYEKGIELGYDAEADEASKVKD